MTALYKGKLPCPGCGRSGEDHPRFFKNALCYDCQQALKIGKTIISEKNLKTKNYQLDEFTTCGLQFHAVAIGPIDSALRKLLRSLTQFKNNEFNVAGNTLLGGDYNSGTNFEYINLPIETAEAAKTLCEVIIRESHGLKKEKNEYQTRLDKQLIEEKNEIFNKGVKYGRNLLNQLRTGEITQNDFNTKDVEMMKTRC